jgi:hypothetical protein
LLVGVGWVCRVKVGRRLSHFWVREVKIGDILAGKKIIVATLEHEACKVAHDGLDLEVKVLEHFVGIPASNEVDYVSVNVSKEEGHGPTGRK